MALESESRFAIPPARFDAVSRDLGRLSELGGYHLRPVGTKEHTDTYYDIDGRLYERGWSLRTRKSGEKLDLTLKRPVADSTAAGHARDELESDRDGTFVEVLEQVGQILLQSGIVSGLPDRLAMRVVRDGVDLTFRRMGLQRMFSVFKPPGAPGR